MTSASERASPHFTDRLELSSRLRDQLEELTAPVRPAAQLIQIEARRQLERSPARSKGGAEPLRSLAPGAIGIQDAEDDARSGQPPQPIEREVGPARAEGRQVPGHRSEPIENTLDQVRLAPASRPLEAQNRLLAWQRQVLHLHLALIRRSADEPDGLAASCLGHDDAAGEEFA